MNKDTLAGIVIKAVRQANSVIDSSYEFPDVDIRTNEEMTFRGNVLGYCIACRDKSRNKQRVAYTRNIIQYIASLYEAEYGKALPMKIKAQKREKVLHFLLTALSGPAALINPLCIFGLVFGPREIMFAGMLEKKLANEYWDCEQKWAVAEELKQATQKEFDEAIYEHWDELTVAFEDIEHR